jgi:hypothetical protein
MMRVGYISGLKVATSCKFLFNGFLSIKYSVEGCSLSVSLVLCWLSVLLLIINGLILLWLCCKKDNADGVALSQRDLRRET